MQAIFPLLELPLQAGTRRKPQHREEKGNFLKAKCRNITAYLGSRRLPCPTTGRGKQPVTLGFQLQALHHHLFPIAMES